MASRRRQLGFAPPEEPTSAIFARVPAAHAAKLDRAAFELKRPKQELVAALIDRYLDELGDDWAVGHASVRTAGAPEVLTLEQLAELLQVEPDALRALAEQGELPGRRVAGEWRFSRTVVLDWLRGERRPSK